MSVSFQKKHEKEKVPSLPNSRYRSLITQNTDTQIHESPPLHHLISNGKKLQRKIVIY